MSSEGKDDMVSSCALTTKIFVIDWTTHTVEGNVYLLETDPYVF